MPHKKPKLSLSQKLYFHRSKYPRYGFKKGTYEVHYLVNPYAEKNLQRGLYFNKRTIHIDTKHKSDKQLKQAIKKRLKKLDSSAIAIVGIAPVARKKFKQVY